MTRRRRALTIALTTLIGGCGGLSLPTTPFEWKIAPITSAIQPGESATFTITILSKNDINSRVGLSVRDGPPGATLSFSPSIIGATGTTSTLTVQTKPDTPLGTFDLTVTACEGGGTGCSSFKNVTLKVGGEHPAPDFILTVDPVDYTFGRGEDSAWFRYRADPQSGFAETVSITLSGLTPDLELTQAPTPAIGAAPLLGDFVLRRVKPIRNDDVTADILVTARGGNRVHAQGIHLKLAAPLGVSCTRTPASGPAVLQVYFSVRLENCAGECRFIWDFGDGRTDNVAVTSHAYVDPGSYTAVGSVTDAGRTANCVRSIDVLPVAPSPPPTSTTTTTTTTTIPTTTTTTTSTTSTTRP